MSNVKKKLQFIENELAARRRFRDTQRIVYVYEGQNCYFNPRKGFVRAPEEAAQSRDGIGRLTLVNVDPLRVIGATVAGELPEARPVRPEDDLLAPPPGFHPTGG